MGDKIIVEIEDNSPDIPASQQETLFEAFVTTKETGTGLGLHITKGLVEMNRGRISFRSKVGMGTAFILEFPVVVPIFPEKI